MTPVPGGEPLPTPSPVQRPERLTPFHEERAVQIYQRNLPHWRQENCTYFVTFRLADSIPQNVRKQWDYEQAQWLSARGIPTTGAPSRRRSRLSRLSPAERFQFDRHFNRQVQACLDRGLGACWLQRLDCIRTLRQEILRQDGVHHHVGDFVIMPNHVHLLTTPIDAARLEVMLKTIKGRAAIACNRLIGRTGAFWQEESHDHIVRHLEQLVFYREYAAKNPSRAGIDLPPQAIYRADWMDEWLTADRW